MECVVKITALRTLWQGLRDNTDQDRSNFYHGPPGSTKNEGRLTAMYSKHKAGKIRQKN